MRPSKSLLALVGSMDFEIEVFERDLQESREHIIEGVRFVNGKLFNQSVVLLCTGGGKVNAGVTLTLLIEHFKPGAVIFTGVAGAVNRNLTLGDVIVGETTLYHDFGEITPTQFKPWRPWQAGTGNPIPMHFQGDEMLLGLARASIARITLPSFTNGGGVRQPKFYVGVIATGDVFCSSTVKKIELYEKFHADAVEMDGAAVAHVCFNRNVACLVIRGISDVTDSCAQEDYDKYCKLAMGNAAVLTRSMVKAYESINLIASLK
jgi:adenosylhomocysteine nucleosidase